MSFRILLFVCLFTLIVDPGIGQDRPGTKKARAPEDYKLRTLKELDQVTTDSALSDKQERLIVTGNILPSRIRATFVGSRRALPQIKGEVIQQWSRLYAGNPEHYTKPYIREMLFEEAGVGYWIAIPETSGSVLKRLKQGDVVDLYLIKLGKARQTEEWQSVLLLENFAKL